MEQPDDIRYEKFDFLYKVVLAGDTKVGKSAILRRYKNTEVPMDTTPTIGVEFSTKIIALATGGTVKAQIWDTAGQERYRAITAAHYKRAVGALLVYDVTQISTFQDIERWAGELRSYAEPNIVVILVGNKVDLVENNPESRQVSTEVAREMAERNGMLFIETSAMDEQNVVEAFETLINEIYKKKHIGEPMPIASTASSKPVQSNLPVEPAVRSEPEENNAQDFLYKMAFIGDDKEGKMGLVYRFMESDRELGVRFNSKIFTLTTGVAAKTQILETSRLERYNNISAEHFSRAVGALFILDVAQMKTFQDIERWVEELRNHAEHGVVIGLLCIKTNEVGSSENDIARQQAERSGILFIEVPGSERNVQGAIETWLSEINKKQSVSETPSIS